MSTTVSGIYLHLDTTKYLADSLQLPRELSYISDSGLLRYLPCSGDYIYFNDIIKTDTQIETYINNIIGIASGLVPLDGDSKIDINYIPSISSELDAIAALTETSGILRKTGINTWSLDTTTYLNNSQTFILTGDIIGSGNYNAINTTLNITIPVTKGGTGKTSWTQYSIPYASDTTTISTISPNTTPTKKFLRMTGTGSVGTTPTWDILVSTDIPSLSDTYSLTSHNHSGIYQPYDQDITTIANISDTSGLLKKTAINTWILDTTNYSISGHTHSFTTLTGGTLGRIPYASSSSIFSDSDNFTFTNTAASGLIIKDPNISGTWTKHSSTGFGIYEGGKQRIWITSEAGGSKGRLEFYDASGTAIRIQGSAGTYTSYNLTLPSSLSPGFIYTESNGNLSFNDSISQSNIYSVSGWITTAIANKQPLDATLTAIAGTTTAADKMLYFTAADTTATTTVTSTARSLLDDTSTSAMRTTLGLAIGSDVQAYDADLTSIAGLTTTSPAGGFLCYVGGSWLFDRNSYSVVGHTHLTRDIFSEVRYGIAYAAAGISEQYLTTDSMFTYNYIGGMLCTSQNDDGIIIYAKNIFSSNSGTFCGIAYYGNNASSADTMYAKAGAEIADSTAGSEDAAFVISAVTAGTMTEQARIVNGVMSGLKQIVIDDTLSGAVIIRRSSTSSAANSLNMGKSATGTTAVASGDLLNSVISQGYDGTSYLSTASTRTYVDGAVSTGVVPQAYTIWTGTTNAGTAERMRISSAGLVGIGTNIPAYKLHIYDTSATTSYIETSTSSSYAQQRISTAGSQLVCRKYGPDASGTFGSGDYSTSNLGAIYNYSGNFLIGTYDSNPTSLMTNGYARLNINSSGNIVISTADSGDELEVSGTALATTYWRTNKSNDTPYSTTGSAATDQICFYNYNDDYASGITRALFSYYRLFGASGHTTTSTSSQNYAWNGVIGGTGMYDPKFIWGAKVGSSVYNELMRLDANAGSPKLMLGVTTSDHNFEAEGYYDNGAKLWGTRGTGLGSALGSGNILTLHCNTATSSSYGLINFTAKEGTLSNHVTYAKIGAHIENTTQNSYDGGLVFATTSNTVLTERMRITSSGNVGIGTTSPDYTLDVSGDIYASSRIIANSTRGISLIGNGSPTVTGDFAHGTTMKSFIGYGGSTGNIGNIRRTTYAMYQTVNLSSPFVYTSILSGSARGTRTMLANHWQPGKVYTISITGDITGEPSSWSFGLFYGSTIVNAVQFSSPTTATTYTYTLRFVCTSTTTIQGSHKIDIDTGSGVFSKIYSFAGSSSLSTTSQVLDIRAVTSDSSAINAFCATIEEC